MEFRGTAIKKQDIESGKVISTRDEPKFRYNWDTGVAMQGYLGGLKAGKLLGTRCTKCARTVIPPRAFCEECFGEMTEWVDLQETGTVNTFSLCYVSWDVQKLETPEIPAVIEIDGADPGMGIMHKLGEVDPSAVKIGMKVRAIWKPETERTGSITDIQYFKPL